MVVCNKIGESSQTLQYNANIMVLWLVIILLHQDVTQQSCKMSHKCNVKLNLVYKMSF